MSAPWNPLTPMVKGNMSTLISNVVRTMERMNIKPFKAIVIVLKRRLGASKYAELLTQNVSNGSNDQKRLVLMTAQAYRNSKKKPRLVKKTRVITVPTHFDPMPSNQGFLPHLVLVKKVNDAIKKCFDKLGINIIKLVGVNIYQIQIGDAMFEKLQRRLNKLGLGLVFKDHSQSNIEGILNIEGDNYDIIVNRRLRKNISGRYGPDKNRIIQIPNYQRLRMLGDYDQQKVVAAVAKEFNWVIEGLNYTTTLTKMSDNKFKVIKGKLRTLKLRMEEYRSTYFDGQYRIVPISNSQETQDRYGRALYV
tara:strand:+ start:1459 stop:2376 length:918 start_codon:yes stop_codon:yes gene_type:complete